MRHIAVANKHKSLLAAINNFDVIEYDQYRFRNKILILNVNDEEKTE